MYKKLKFRKKTSFILVPLMVLYVFIPCISQAAPAITDLKNPCHDAYHSANSIQPTAAITYFYDGFTLMNAADDNGNMSTYLGRTVRSIVNVNTQTVVDTQCLFTDGKNVISQTDSTGTTITSTQQYNAYGQPVNYNSDTDSKIPKSTNQPLSIATNPFQYDGYYYDNESGLYYLNARYYSPALMQFISMDTYDLANRYGYCGGNPIGNVDPTGHMSLPSLILAAEEPIDIALNFFDDNIVGAVEDATLEYFLIKNVKTGGNDAIDWGLMGVQMAGSTIGIFSSIRNLKNLSEFDFG